MASAMDELRTTSAAELSLRVLARKVGASHQAPYRHFGDRQGFLVALAAQCLAELTREQRVAIDAATTDRERVLAAGSAYVRWAGENPHAFQLVFDCSVNPPGAPPADLAEAIDAHAVILRETTERAATAGLVGDSPASATALWGLVHGLADLITLGHTTPEGAADALGALLFPGGA